MACLGCGIRECHLVLCKCEGTDHPEFGRVGVA